LSIAALLDDELARFEREHPPSRELATTAKGSYATGTVLVTP
jgi:hypothetical protein